MGLVEIPEDFVVEEIPLFAPCGEGGHTFVRVEKRLCDTEGVARQLARHAGVPVREVGYAGRKDRVAVARQWLSVPGLEPERALGFEGRGFRVLEAVPHRHKLRTGQLRGNRFELRLRGVAAEQRARAEERLPELAQSGFANRFGPQRFGRGGGNAALGREILRSGRSGPDRRAARFLVSAYQAWLFNAFLARRGPPFDRLETGERAWKHDSGATFVVDDEVACSQRARAGEISPSGPLIGTRMPQPKGQPAERESRWLRGWGAPDPLVPPPGLRLRGGRRPLRSFAADLSWHWEAAEVLLLGFTLAPGSYASVLAEEILGLPPRPS